MQLHTHFRPHLLIALGTLGFSACNSQLDLGAETSYPQKFSRNHAVLEAVYAKPLALSPNTLARYPGFQLKLTDITVVGQDHLAKVAGEHYSYQLETLTSQALGTLVLSPENINKPRQFTIGNSRYFIRRNADRFSITVNDASRQLVKN